MVKTIPFKISNKDPTFDSEWKKEKRRSYCWGTVCQRHIIL